MTSTQAVVIPKLICEDCDAAITFYRRVFDASETDRFTSPEGVIVHAEIAIGKTQLFLADAAPDFGNHSAVELNVSPVILTLTCDNPDEIAESAEKHGAIIVFPVDDRFYGFREGRIRDPFGHVWILSKEVKAMSSAEIQQGVDEFDIRGISTPAHE